MLIYTPLLALKIFFVEFQKKILIKKISIKKNKQFKQEYFMNLETGTRAQQFYDENVGLFTADISKTHSYNTRINKKYNLNGIIQLGYSSSIADINILLREMRNNLPGIHYRCNFGNILERINIQCTRHGFIIKGKNIDMYSLLENPQGINFLIAISFDKNSPNKVINNKLFDQNFKPITIDNKILEQQCSICLSQFDEQQEVTKTACGHLFHIHCLKHWLTQSCRLPNCPNCRNELV